MQQPQAPGRREGVRGNTHGIFRNQWHPRHAEDRRHQRHASSIPSARSSARSDATLGEGEFIYLQGRGLHGRGLHRQLRRRLPDRARHVGNGGPSRPLAVAMSANVANYYGWYQISGLAVAVKARTRSRSLTARVSAAGSGLAVAVATGCLMQGAIVARSPRRKSRRDRRRGLRSTVRTTLGLQVTDRDGGGDNRLTA